jgi:hypothetical protein
LEKLKHFRTGIQISMSIKMDWNAALFSYLPMVYKLLLLYKGKGKELGQGSTQGS